MRGAEERKPLTPRQQDVLDEVCKGKSNKRIARDLGIAETTVKLHLTEIFRNLDVQTRTQAILRSTDRGISIQETAHSDPAQELSDREILQEFANLTFNESGAQLALKFGRAIEKLSNTKRPIGKEQ